MIVRPIFRATCAEVLFSPIRLGLIALVLLPRWLFVIFGGVPTPTQGSGVWLALILGAGLIGRPAANGTLALVLSRPVRRIDFVLTRWIAVSTLAGALAGGNLLLLGLLRAAKSGEGHWLHLASNIGEDMLGATGMASILTLLSSLAGGIGDAALLAILVFGAEVIKQLGGFLSKPGLNWLGHHLIEWLMPTIDLETTFLSSPISWFAVASYFSTITLCLAGAIELLRRREISYASGGD